MRHFVSLGGWCGPALMISKLGCGTYPHPLPFNMTRATLDSILLFSRRSEMLRTSPDEEGFFPQKVTNRDGQGEYLSDPVSIWLLFRGHHTAFTHFDLNNDAVQMSFTERFEAWHNLLTHPVQRRSPVTFVRTILAEDPANEIRLAPVLLRTLRELRGHSDDRLVLISHGQRHLLPDGHTDAAHCLGMVGTDAISVWCLPLQQGGGGLLDRTHDGYAHILSCTARDQWWEGQRAMPQVQLEVNASLSRVEGIPVHTSTCTGFGSTFLSVGMPCPHCGSIGHPLSCRDAFDSKRPWSEEEDAAVLAAFLGRNTSFDEVAVVEALALELSRGANECQLRLRELSRLAQAER